MEFTAGSKIDAGLAHKIPTKESNEGEFSVGRDLAPSENAPVKLKKKLEPATFNRCDLSIFSRPCKELMSCFTCTSPAHPVQSDPFFVSDSGELESRHLGFQYSNRV